MTLSKQVSNEFRAMILEVNNLEYVQDLANRLANENYSIDWFLFRLWHTVPDFKRDQILALDNVDPKIVKASDLSAMMRVAFEDVILDTGFRK